MPLSISFVQDGSRLHYAVPEALHQQGILHSIFADAVLPPGPVANLVARGIAVASPSRGSHLAERRIHGIPRSKLRTNLPLRAFIEAMRPTFADTVSFHQWESEQIFRWVRRSGMGTATAVHAFVRNVHPKLLAHAKNCGLAAFADQIIAPAATEREEHDRQIDRWPHWHIQSSPLDYDAIQRWEERTWENVDHLVCPSEYVAREMGRQGFHDTSVHPYPFDPPPLPTRMPNQDRKLTVGFVGSVSLRKGAPYFLEVARRLSRRTTFVMVGPVNVAPEARNSLSKHVQLVGRVPRSQVPSWMGQFDVFLFPSTCEGCAGVSIEALAAGLPVVTSPNAGTVVRHGVDGYVHEYDAVEAYVEALTHLDDDRSLLAKLSANARERSKQFRIAEYGTRLAATFNATRRAGDSTPLQ